MQIWIDRWGKLRTGPRPAPTRFRELSLERGSELPWFPRYQVLVRSDGSVEWNGQSVVAESGRREWTLSNDQIEALQQLLLQASFAPYEDGGRMFGDETPLPTISIVFEDGETFTANTLVDWSDPRAIGQALKLFNALADAIEDIVGTAPYIHAPYPGDKRSMSFWSLTLERGPCYGDCPMYAVNVGFDGSVDWIGEAWVDAKGDRSWNVSDDVVEKLRQSLVKAKFLDMDDRYDNFGMTDQPSATITVQFADGKTKRVYHYHGHLIESAEEHEVVKRLEWLQNRIDRLVGTKEYIGKRS